MFLSRILHDATLPLSLSYVRLSIVSSLYFVYTVALAYVSFVLYLLIKPNYKKRPSKKG